MVVQRDTQGDEDSMRTITRTASIKPLSIWWFPVLCFIASSTGTYVGNVLYAHNHNAQQAVGQHPLNVTVLDDGGADLKVETTVTPSKGTTR